LAKIACALSGVAWGLFWFPLRWLDEAGITGPWIGVVFFTAQLLCFLPIALLRLPHIRRGGTGMIITGLFAGGAFALYALAIVYTEVIRAMLLFYLTPIWSSLLARWFLKQPITIMRWFAIALALSGLLIILGIDVGVPWPRNVGDWFGLISGISWAIAAVRLNLDDRNDPMEITFTFFTWGGLLCLALTLVLTGGLADAPAWSTIQPTLIWLLPMVALIILPGSYATMWGARLIDPGIVGILLMTEIITGTVTIAIWAGEPFGWRELTGVLLIAGAGLIESLWEVWRRRRTRLV
jgi:drug/metabolite transporter (DMT)-like permease